MIEERTIRRVSGIAAIPAWLGAVTLAVAIGVAPRRNAGRLLAPEGIAANGAACLTILHVLLRYRRPDGDDMAVILKLGRDLGRDLAERAATTPPDVPAPDDSLPEAPPKL